ncbi:unnamed protein product [Trichobilharzia szidati]|nr:unnamed protein product [Trichobilharzia szidati]CAH8845979.1 unnamed protein product [Trichobilharzia szidati]
MTNSQANLTNKHLHNLKEDVLYHLGISTNSFNFKEKFGDVKFVCTCGSAGRIIKFATAMAEEAGQKTPPENIAGSSARFVLFKVDRTLFVDHGMGVPSTLIAIHEITKLLQYAGCKDVLFIRIGTSGGVGVKAGTLVISNSCVNTKFEPIQEMCILGKVVRRPTAVDVNAANDLKNLAESMKLKCDVVVGATMTANDFYEEQARLDGAICSFSEEEKKAYLQSAYDNGIRNIEMEGTGIAGHCKQVGYRAVLVCVTLVNRLEVDQVSLTEKEYAYLQELPGMLVGEYLKKNGGISHSGKPSNKSVTNGKT